jgi:hypothetical protein
MGDGYQQVKIGGLVTYLAPQQVCLANAMTRFPSGLVVLSVIEKFETFQKNSSWSIGLSTTTFYLFICYY